MNRLDVSPYGAKVQSFTAVNPRGLLFQIINEHPKANEQELFDLCLEEIEKKPEFIEAIVEYWFTNTYRSLKPWQNNPRRSLRPMIDSIKSQIRLLDVILPGGKTLGESTGAECVAFGGWLSAVGERVGDRVVGAVLSEQQLRIMLADKE